MTPSSWSFSTKLSALENFYMLCLASVCLHLLSNILFTLSLVITVSQGLWKLKRRKWATVNVCMYVCIIFVCRHPHMFPPSPLLLNFRSRLPFCLVFFSTPNPTLLVDVINGWFFEHSRYKSFETVSGVLFFYLTIEIWSLL